MPNTLTTRKKGGMGYTSPPTKVKPKLGPPTTKPPEKGKPPMAADSANKRRRLGGGRWRKNAAGQGGRGSMGQRAGGRGQGQGGAPGRPGGGKRPGNRRGTPERQAIHAQRQADRRAGTRPRMGGGPMNQMNQGGSPWQGGMPMDLQHMITQGGPMATGNNPFGQMGGMGSALGSKGGQMPPQMGQGMGMRPMNGPFMR